jgi:hypothetical protein
MSAEANLATVKGIDDSFGKGDVPAILDQLTRFAMKSKETGREATMGLMHYWHFRDGKVDHYRGTEATAATLEMLGR